MRQKLARAVRRFRVFNRSEPRTVRRVQLDFSGPLVRIGEVPEIHYLSEKEGEPAHYVHKVKSPGVMYAGDGFFLIVGGSTRVDDWLRD